MTNESLAVFKRRIYLYTFVASYMPIYSLYAIMLNERGGLSASEVAFIFSWWSLIGIVSEVPTGIWADVFSSKGSLVIACAFQIICFTTWLIFPNFLGYLIGFAFWGVGGAFGSGSLQAYIYNKLDEQKAKKDFIKLYGRASAFGSASLMLAYFSTSIFNFTYDLSILISMVLSLFAIIVAISLPKIKETERREDRLTIKVVSGALNEIINSKRTLTGILLLALLGAILVILIEFAPLFYQNVGAPNRYIPILLGIGYGLTSLVSWIAHRYEGGGYKFSFFIVMIGGVMMVIGTFGGAVASIVSVILFIRVMRLSSLLFENELHHSIGNKSRATIHSISCFISGLVTAVLMATYGLLASISSSHMINFRIATITAVLIALAGYYRMRRVGKYEPA